jgi:hypothetical protein
MKQQRVEKNDYPSTSSLSTTVLSRLYSSWLEWCDEGTKIVMTSGNQLKATKLLTPIGQQRRQIKIVFKGSLRTIRVFKLDCFKQRIAVCLWSSLFINL